MDVHNVETLALSIVFACFSIMLALIGFLAKIVFNFVWNRQQTNEKDIQALWNYVRNTEHLDNELQSPPEQTPQIKK